MKLETRVLQNLTQQQKLSQRQQQDLKILEMNNQDLESWIEEELEKIRYWNLTRLMKQVPPLVPREILTCF